MALNSQTELLQYSEIILYDGLCGLCDRAVSFVARHDYAGKFRFAPLHGATFYAELSPIQRDSLPDTMAVLTRGGSLLIRSDAWAHVLRQLGGVWAMAGALLGLVPRAFRDRVYDWVAGVRHRLFKRRDGKGQIGPCAVRARFRP